MGSDLHVEANGARFAVTVEGDGPAVVLLHAGVADRRMWAPVAALLRDDGCVVTFDLRGFGDTDVGDTPFAHHADVLALVDGLDLVRPVLAGSSFGGKVALEAAVVAPERFSRLVLFAPPLPGHEWSERAEEFDAAESAALEAGDIDRAVAVNVELWAAGLGAAERDLVAAMQRRAFELQ